MRGVASLPMVLRGEALVGGVGDFKVDGDGCESQL
jgi:hypothetical protein